MDKILFSERFKELRLKNGYRTQNDLARAYNEKFPPLRKDKKPENENKTSGILGTIKNLENPNSPIISKLDTVENFCTLFHCHIDYLLGHIQTKTYDIKFIQDVTGLSENAIECLSQWNSEAQDKSDSIHAAGYGREFLDSQIGYTSNEYLDIINLLFEIRHETDRNGNCSDSPNSHVFYLLHSYLNHNIKSISNVTKDDYESLEISEDGIQVSENSDGVVDEFNLSDIHKRITLDKIRDELEEIAKWKSANDK